MALKTPDPRKGVFKRDTATGRDAAEYPWVARCSAPGCNFAISARSEGGAAGKLDSHERGYGPPCPFNSAQPAKAADGIQLF